MNACMHVGTEYIYVSISTYMYSVIYEYMKIEMKQKSKCTEMMNKKLHNFLIVELCIYSKCML